MHSIKKRVGIHLQKRRKYRKLCLFYQINNYVTIDALSVYKFRYARNIYIYLYHSVKHNYFAGYFSYPSTLKILNDLPLSITDSSSLSSFKSKTTIQTKCAPSYCSCCLSKYYILLTKRRYSYSQLHCDLFTTGLIDSPNCLCCSPCENVYHYLISCPSYRPARNIMFHSSL